jgi:arsenate reductase
VTEPREHATADRRDWALPDPADKPPEEVRPIRDAIDERARSLLEELVPAVL